MAVVVVTGGAGFLGSHLCQRLLDDGCEVIAFDNTALQLRVADEVRDRRRASAFAALVRLEVRLEAVA